MLGPDRILQVVLLLTERLINRRSASSKPSAIVGIRSFGSPLPGGRDVEDGGLCRSRV